MENDINDPVWRSATRYTKARLSERLWQKYVIYTPDRDGILRMLRELDGPVMFRLGSGFVLAMIADDIDRVAFHLRLPTKLALDSNRGYGMWGGKKYNCANSNRIRVVPSSGSAA